MYWQLFRFYTLWDLCINRNNHQKPTFHPLGDFLNPALALLGQVLGVFGKKGDEGGFARASLDYAIDDKISISGGIIDYIGGSSMTDPPSLIPVYSTPIKLSILDFVSVSPEYLMVSK
jgi:hypothetical protein